MATMPSFLSRLTRPFSTSTTPLRLTPESNGSAASAAPAGAQKCTVAAGCFWGVEHIYRRHFDGGRGLLEARVGYIGGDTAAPSYRSVCSGRTGHAEALQLLFDPAVVSYRQLLEFFYRMHDPTTKDAQGFDSGTQYRSAIFFHDDEQRRVAEEVTAQASRQWWKGKVVTEVVPAGEWFDAEKYHQLYLDKNPDGYQCASHFLRKFPPLE